MAKLGQVLGVRIEEARKRAGMSIADFAMCVGVSERLLRYWLRGQRMPTVEGLMRVALIADVQASWMLYPVDGKEREILADG